MTRTDIIRELLIEGVDDWVPVDTLLALVRQAEDPPERDVRSLTASILHQLIEQGFIQVGEIGDSGFEAWPEGADDAVVKAVTALDAVDWMPHGGAFWLANTPLGDRRAAL